MTKPEMKVNTPIRIIEALISANFLANLGGDRSSKIFTIDLY